VDVQQTPHSLIVRLTRMTLQFEWRHDRWQHVVESSDGRPWRVVSVEGGPDDTIPCSPAFQDLWFERRDDSHCEVQAMGQAGVAIYSVAVHVDGERNRLEFDVCARRKKARGPFWARSRYQIPGVPAGEGSRTWLQAQGVDCRMEPLETSTARPPEDLVFEGDGFVAGYPAPLVGAEQSDLLQWRWKYTIEAVGQA